MSGPAPGHTLRYDIQGLRTLAVGLVVLYHLFPSRLTGGFVGVDIFFVISGFLIVGSLVRGVERTGDIRLLAFYARRIRRLLPAGTAVLLATVAAAVLLLPQSRWQEVGRDVVASALQVQNWNQALGSASYESAGALVSPLQHYWSLAVEEQFYLIIPLLLLAAVACGRRLHQSAGTAGLWFLVAMSAASLVHSAILSSQNHDLAYFATTTRMWELGLGGIAALVLPRLRMPGSVRAAGGWLGFAMVMASALAFQTAMAFPGFIALLPVLGTVLIIAAGQPGQPGASRPTPDRWGISHQLSRRPVTYLGDISYSLYLWHWPVIVFYILLRGHEPGIIGGAGIIALSLALASLSYHHIEQRFRFGTPVRHHNGLRYRPVVRNRSAYGLAGALVALSCLAAAGPWAVVQAKTNQFATVVTTDYPGALAFDRKAPAAVSAGLPIRPDPAVATKDVPLTTKDGCAVYDPRTTPETKCWYGDPAATRTMVLVGDSHAAQYIDPLAAIGTRTGWKVKAMVRNGCPFSTAPPASATTTYTNCSSQNAVTLAKIIASRPQEVFVAGMTPDGYGKSLKWGWPDTAALVDGYVHMFKSLRDAGITVSVIEDIPYPQVSVPDCVATHGPSSHLCVVSERSPTPDPLRQAAGRVPGVHAINLNGYLCRDGACPPVVGNVLVFRDNHLTATFARTLERPLEAAMSLR
ncbi:acyltransferase family protein [Specibacter sp. RAF43]|uniref:acyltransferase family protein n=1 Tax=Specibacter sp. RAF43 TaxID=3233057 RepID=UPI003F95E866